MRKLRVLLYLPLVVGGLLTCVPGVMAIGPFKDAFEDKYVKPDSSAPKDVRFAAAFAEARCDVCHSGMKKEERNVYGRALAELLDWQEDRDNKEKIQSALDKVAGMKRDPKNEESPTFGQLIEQGKLPGADEE